MKIFLHFVIAFICIAVWVSVVSPDKLEASQSKIATYFKVIHRDYNVGLMIIEEISTGCQYITSRGHRDKITAITPRLDSNGKKIC